MIETLIQIILYYSFIIIYINNKVLLLYLIHNTHIIFNYIIVYNNNICNK